MTRVESHDLDRAVATMRSVLEPRVEADWTVLAGQLEWDCWTTAAHVAHDLLAYAGQVAGHAQDGYLPFDLVVRPTAGPAEVLRVTRASANLLRAAVDTSPPDASAWHWGAADPTGFTAMGIGEILLHTYDIVQGLGSRWAPPEDLCARVLRRLAPDAPSGDPARVLLWYTGRGELDGRARRTSWGWHAATPRL